MVGWMKLNGDLPTRSRGGVGNAHAALKETGDIDEENDVGPLHMLAPSHSEAVQFSGEPGIKCVSAGPLNMSDMA